MAKDKQGLEETIKEKVAPLLGQTMEKSWGITIPQIESDITDKLRHSLLQMYIPSHLSFSDAKKRFKAEFLKKELSLHLGNVSQLAKTLGIDRRSIHRAIKSLDIDVEELRGASDTQQDQYQEIIDRTLRSSLEQYKNLIQPQQLEKMYLEVPSLSRNIAQVLPHQDITWKEAEKEFEKQFLEHVLQEKETTLLKTAKRLNIRPETLYRKVKKFGL